MSHLKALLVLSVLFIISCSPTSYYRYSSREGIEYLSSITKTEFELIGNITEGIGGSGPAVIYAKDNGEKDYLLIATKGNGTIASIAMNQTAHLNKEDVQKAIKTIDSFLKDRDQILGTESGQGIAKQILKKTNYAFGNNIISANDMSDSLGIHYVFASVPEYKTTAISDTTLLFVPAFRMTLLHNGTGSWAGIEIIRDFDGYRYYSAHKFKNIDEVVLFREFLYKGSVMLK